MTQFDKNKTAEEAFFQKIQPPFKEDKEAIWERLSTQIEEQPKGGKTRTIKGFYWAAAASVLLLIGASIFASTYNIKVETALAEQTAVQLPDGSTVQLNAASQLSYKPYWWWMKRELQFEGEGFFEVEKGSKFTVRSAAGQTTVLGTSFNIKTYNLAYQVYCATGKVQVNVGDRQQILTPGESAYKSFKFGLKKQKATSEKITAWQANKLSFDQLWLDKVFSELDRQYAVKISYADQLKNIRYSGFYEKPKTIEDALELICLTLKLKYRKISSNQYEVYQ